MKIFGRHSVGAIVSFLLAFILMMVWYRFYLIHSDSYFISIWGDGFKNYYTFAYYVNYDHGSHFTGMNYPFGEHVVFTDDQPILAFVYQHLSHIGFVRDHLHCFFTVGTFLSIPICALVIFLVLAEFGVDGIVAIVAAVFMTMLSPQITRLPGHFGLSYCFFIPLSTLLLIRVSRTGSNAYLILFSILVTVFGLIHMYHLAIISFFGLVYATIYYLTGPKNRSNFILFIKQVIASLTPFLLIKIFILLTDHVTDRPDNPWGFFDTTSTFYSIFLLPYSFLYQFIAKYVSMPNPQGEKWAYIGIVADLTMVVFVVTLIFRFALTRRIFQGVPRSLPVAFAASIVLLLFSFGLPFTIDGCKWLFDHMGPVRQFRAPCRFAWVFYYMSNIFAVVYISRVISLSDTRIWLRRGVVICVFVLWFIDLNMVNNRMAADWSSFGGRINIKEDTAKINTLLKSHGLSVRNFQAMLFFPYFTIGSEKSYISGGGDIQGMKVSLYTGLNMVDFAMSRTSLSQTNMNLQLISSPLLKKEVLKYYHSALPLLLVTQRRARCLENELTLIDRANYIGNAFIFPDTLYFYSLPLTAFADSSGIVRSQLDHMMATMHRHGGYYSSDSADDVVIHTYDDQKAEFVRFGKGALYLEHKGVTLFDDTLPAAIDSGSYELSVWNYGDHRVSVYPSYKITIYSPKHDRLAQYERLAYESKDVFENWKRTSLQFVLPSRYCSVRVEGAGDYATYDELMIRPANSGVLSHCADTGLFMYNNYPIPK